MTTRSPRPLALAFAMAVIALMVTFGASSASAQFKCDPLKIVNNTKCEITGALVSPFSDLVVPFAVGPGQSISVPFGLPIETVEVNDACGVVWGLKQTGCLKNIQARGGCCFDFCLDTKSCLVTFTPSAGPCPCK